jgi:hypothetical protein
VEWQAWGHGVAGIFFLDVVDDFLVDWFLEIRLDGRHRNVILCGEDGECDDKHFMCLPQSTHYVQQAPTSTQEAGMTNGLHARFVAYNNS